MESTLNSLLLDIASGLTASDFEARVSERTKKDYLTTRTINVTGNMPVPGKPGLVGDVQITFCVNVRNFSTAEQAQERAKNRADAALASLEALPDDVRAALLEKYAVKA